MTSAARTAIIGVLMLIASSTTARDVFAAIRPTGDPQDAEPRVVRVRALDGSLTAMIREAAAHSATFKRLLDEVDGTDGLVYVERGRCSRGVRACLYFPEDARGRTRVLRIIIDDRKSDRDVIASIGHELQHAMEVLREPAVRGPAQMHFFYHRQARRIGDTFETDAAIDAGEAVRAELKKWPASN